MLIRYIDFVFKFSGVVGWLEGLRRKGLGFYESCLALRHVQRLQGYCRIESLDRGQLGNLKLFETNCWTTTIHLECSHRLLIRVVELQCVFPYYCPLNGQRL